MRVTTTLPPGDYPTPPAVGERLPLIFGEEVVFLAEVLAVRASAEQGTEVDLNLLGARIGVWGGVPVVYG